MSSSSRIDLSVAVAELGGVFAFFLAVVCSLVFRSRRHQSISRPGSFEHGFYTDKDGEGTRESSARFLDGLPGNLLTTCATSGLLTSIAHGVWTVLRVHEYRIERWLQVGAWALVLTQCLILRFEIASIRQYSLGMLIFTSSTLLVLGLVWSGSHDVIQFHRHRQLLAASCAFDLSEAILGIVIMVYSLSLPRRPDVYYKEKLVDRQFTVSAINRYSFSWASSLLALGKARSMIDFSDLPVMNYDTRAENLQSRLHFLHAAQHQSLFFLLYKSHRAIFHWQWFLTMLQSIVAYGPQFCMYRILKLLELQNATGEKSTDLWLWAAGLGLIRLFQTFVEARLNWLSFATLAISIRSQLSAAIFHKSMRMRIVKDERAVDHNADVEEEATSDNESEEDYLLKEDGGDEIHLRQLSNDGSKMDHSKKDPPSGNQDGVNLLSVDAQRISDFCAYNNIFPSVVVTSGIAVWVLVNLIGWASLGAGLVAPLLLTPVNAWASKAYNKAQIDLMKARDEKAKLLTEALQGIRQIKFSATESQWQDRIMQIRKVELKQQWKIFMWALCLRFCWVASPIFLSLAALATYAWLNGSLSASVAFTSLAVFGNLEWCLSVVPLAIAQFLDARVSGTRILGLLKSFEKGDKTKPGEFVDFKDAMIQWPGNGKFKLNINIQFPNGELSIIHGRSGSGKSLLLSSIIGESDVLSGSVVVPKPSPLKVTNEWIVPGSIAYVAQTPWLENATVKSNILFGLQFHANRYHEAIEASALRGDLQTLPDGEMTEIGARGINLSGGQRWRVSLARAFYSRANILVLDDIFSAVDTHVGRHILEKGLMGRLCRGRTRILATHHTTLCAPKAACVVYLRNGIGVKQVNFPKRESDPVDLGDPGDCETANIAQLGDSKIEEASADEDYESIAVENRNLTTAKKFVEDEFRELGNVKWAIYKKYLGASGGVWLWAPALASIAASQLAVLGRGWWMKVWTESNAEPSSRKASTSLNFFLIIYIAISFAAALLEILKTFIVYTGGLRASQSLFSGLINKVLRAQTRWLDTVPLGRILNRFTADFNSIDSKVPAENHALLSAMMMLVCVFIAGMLLSVYMAAPYLVLLGLSIYFTFQYIDGAREIRRLEATARSPILDLFGNSVLGLETIRAFDKADEYTARMYSRIDDWSQSTWAFWLVTQWMSFRMGLMGTLFTLSVAIGIVALKNVDASLAGFVLIFALNYSKGMEDTIKRSANFQFNMNSIERVVEFSDMETESQGGEDAPAAWPSIGGIDIRDLQVTYAPDLSPVLHDFTVSIAPRQRVGVVGRTGAGKSSLTLALFRCLEAQTGSIFIDGIDISNIKLQHLRSRMTLIPQDPVLFSGTVRSNLDPFGHFSDNELYECLRRVHLIDSPNSLAEEKGEETTLFTNVYSHVHEGGQNLSQGQRQLLCLARAVLTRTKIMVLDEATSAVDMATDVLIQRSIREQFAQSTLIVIAHRLSTVVDFDRILVMAEGKVEEIGSPKELLEKRGAFWRMVSSSEDENDLRNNIVGQ